MLKTLLNCRSIRLIKDPLTGGGGGGGDGSDFFWFPTFWIPTFCNSVSGVMLCVKFVEPCIQQSSLPMPIWITGHLELCKHFVTVELIHYKI